MADGFEYSYEADSRIADDLPLHSTPPVLSWSNSCENCCKQDANGRRNKLGTVKNGNQNHPETHETVRLGQMNLKSSAVLKIHCQHVSSRHIKANIPEGLRAAKLLLHQQWAVHIAGKLPDSVKMSGIIFWTPGP
ncbi:hypothetical protein niasHT_031399 [Heterodera trifolii]|uniref:Uncharacterized protein n=1 Tax=Heterodera trifolii TaxID=157864 RepID=A0ABD2J007_9BILA